MKRVILAILCSIAVVLAMAACAPAEPADTEAPVTTESTEPATDPADTDEPTSEAPDTDEPVTDTEQPTSEAPDTDEPATGGDTPTATQHTGRTARPTSAAPKTVKTTAITTNPHATLAKDKVVDLDGFTFKYGTAWKFQTTIAASTLPDFIWHDRMNEVMEQYNCNIKVTSVYGSAETIKANIMANKTPAHVIEMLYGTMFMPALGAGWLQSWDDLPDSPINPADARWSHNQLAVSPFNGKVYGMNMVSTGFPNIRDCVFANLTLLKKNGVNIDELYNAVDSKKWNWDLMRTYALACTKDTNSDGKNDTWGIVGEYGFMFFDFPYTNGGRMITVKNGVLTDTMGSTENLEGLLFIDKLINTDKVVYFPAEFYSDTTWDKAKLDAVQFFLEGNTAFCFHEGWNFDQQLRPNAKFEFAYLPLPMGPRATDYVSPAGNNSCDVILHTASAKADIGKALIVYNAWARPYKDVLDYREEEESTHFLPTDERSYDLFIKSSDWQFLDYGEAVTEMRMAFNHCAVSSILWGMQSVQAAVESMGGSNYNDTIAAIFGNAER